MNAITAFDIAAAVLDDASAAGVAVFVLDGEVCLTYDPEIEPPPTMFAAIMQNQAAILALLIKETPAVAFETRVARWLDQHPEPSPPGRCAWCGQAEAPGAVVVPFGTGPHTWLHGECWPAWFQARKAQAMEAVRRECRPIEVVTTRALPDLRQLVERYGGHDRITLEAWAKCDKDVAKYRRAKIMKLHDEQARNRNGGKIPPSADLTGPQIEGRAPEGAQQAEEKAKPRACANSKEGESATGSFYSDPVPF
jgi:hypothetical protein